MGSSAYFLEGHFPGGEPKSVPPYEDLGHPLLLIFARVTHHELARTVQYLKVENAILRSKLPTMVQVTPRERARLVKYGKLVGDKIKDLIQIVTPRTFVRWVNGETRRSEPAKPGRPRTAEYIRELVLKIARETQRRLPD